MNENYFCENKACPHHVTLPKSSGPGPKFLHVRTSPPAFDVENIAAIEAINAAEVRTVTRSAYAFKKNKDRVGDPYTWFCDDCCAIIEGLNFIKPQDKKCDNRVTKK
jgi:hypothetical protein